MKTKKHHYCYRIYNTESGRFYIGVRSSDCKPEADLKYWGSSKWLKAEMKAGGNWVKEIISRHTTRKNAAKWEHIHIKKSWHDEKIINRSLAGHSYATIKSDTRSASLLAHYADPVNREQHAARMASPEIRAAMVAGQANIEPAKKKAMHEKRIRTARANGTLGIKHKPTWLCKATKEQRSTWMKKAWQKRKSSKTS